ncbi:hypothetical protein CYY_009819 [Polysphondylium violaceum]|uniref:Uncharacterized protein n=1 Tax=Polysphondylium violaceum TaxID=133409 RepID=A0A8J4PJM8_9MYCE|nr:hypothetical protein CYY_009819 [Polysphondylium violaceum]
MENNKKQDMINSLHINQYDEKIDFETIQKMKVEEYIQYHIDQQINQLNNHLEKKIQEINEKKEKVKADLLKELQSQS